MTISGLEPTDKNNNSYTYRAVRRRNGVFSENGVTSSTSNTDKYGRVTVTVTPTDQNYFAFKLQRKLTNADDSTYADFNGQWELIDDMWRDIPDFYQFDGSTDHKLYEYYPGIGNQNATEEKARAYDNGTITNKLVKEVEIPVNKLWQSIDPKFESQNYPIADVFLYANLKTEAEAGDYNTAQYAGNKNFADGGYAIIGNKSDSDDEKYALGKLMNILQISYEASVKPGTQTYHFTKQRIIKKDTHGDILYQGNTDYVQFDDNFEGFDGQQGSLRLEKYDDEGALIKYSLKERAINGYTYRIDNDTIINTYDGGGRVRVKVTKNWRNMEAVERFPTVRFILHQCYVGKEKNPVTAMYEYALIDYNIFTQDIRASNSDPVSYTFGNSDKDILYQYSPTGEEFFYYVTEELLDADGKGRVSFRKKYTVDKDKNISEPQVMTYSYDNNEMVLTDDMKLAGMGFTCTITESDEDSFKADDNGVITVPRSDAVDISATSGGTIKVQVENLPSGTYRVVEEISNTELTSTQEEKDGKVTVKIEKALPRENPPENIQFKILDSNNNVVIDNDGERIKAVNQSLNHSSSSEEEAPIYKRVDVTNDYCPSEENFKSVITIDKNWELFKENNQEKKQNPLNEKEFANINNYTFTLKRKTKWIPEKSLFTISTGEMNSDICNPTVTILDKALFGNDTVSFERKKADGTVTENDDEIAYYQATLTMNVYKNANQTVNPIDVRIKVDKTTKQVVIEGLAIYGKDGLLYTYTVEEATNPQNAFEPKDEPKDGIISKKIDPVYSMSLEISPTGSNDLHFKLQRRVKGEETYLDLTEDIINSENIAAKDGATEHTFTPDSNGEYEIPKEFAQPYGNNEKKFTVVIPPLLS